MTKTELITCMLRKNNELSEKEMGSSVNLILDIITQILAAKKRVEIRGFGSFKLNYWGPRHARDPKTGETWRTEPTFNVHFRPGKALRAAVLGDPQEHGTPQNFGEDTVDATSNTLSDDGIFNTPEII